MAPLFSEEATSDVVSDLLHEDDGVAVWWGTWVECSVAISRLRREGRLDEEGESDARTSLDTLAEDWREVQPTDEMRSLSALISQHHPLKAADCFQLAVAFVWRESTDEDPEFVCLDDRLRRAASDEGFDVLPEPSENG